MKIKLLFFLGLVFLSLYSCKKRKQIKPELPAITLEGKNTFGCMFNNELWLPGNYITLAYPPLSGRYTPESELMIVCRRISPASNEGFKDYLFIAFNKPDLKTGEYELNNLNTRLVVDINVPGASPKPYELYNTGNLTLSRVDLVNNIVSGTFSFRVKEKNTGEIVNVTHGRFDLVIKRY